MGSDSANNSIQDNFLRNNTEHDCHDDSVGTGTAGTANNWINNDGLTENRPGLCIGARGDDDNDPEDDEDGADPNHVHHKGGGGGDQRGRD
jgi:hypothetical protein